MTPFGQQKFDADDKNVYSSFQIEESKGKEQAEIAKAKDSAAKGWLSPPPILWQKPSKDLKLKAPPNPALTDLEWHTWTADEVIQKLTTSSTTGLSQDQVKRRVGEYGRNAPSPPKTHYFRTWFGYFFGGFGSILLVGAILVFISWKPLGDPPAIANLVRL